MTENEDVSEYTNLSNVADAEMYDAVWAVVINVEALTQDAEYAFIDCVENNDWVAYPTLLGNDIGGAYDALKAYEALLTLDVIKYDAVSELVIWLDADTHDALNTDVGNGG